MRIHLIRTQASHVKSYFVHLSLLVALQSILFVICIPSTWFIICIPSTWSIASLILPGPLSHFGTRTIHREFNGANRLGSTSHFPSKRRSGFETKTNGFLDSAYIVHGHDILRSSVIRTFHGCFYHEMYLHSCWNGKS